MKPCSWTGITRPDDRTVWISGSIRAGQRTQPKFERTLVHEAGHVMLDWENQNDSGFGHPDKEGGKAPLPGTDRTRRLMVSGPSQGPNPGKLLVKTEWDRIEEWMKRIIDGPQP